MVSDCQAHFTLRHAVAADVLLTGRTMSGQGAAERGIAGRVLPAAIDLARDVAGAPTRTVDLEGLGHRRSRITEVSAELATPARGDG